MKNMINTVYTFVCITYLYFLSGTDGAYRLHVYSRTEHSLAVTWDGPIAGDMVEYIIKLPSMQGTEKIIKDLTITTANITGLVAGRQYTVVLVIVHEDKQTQIIQDIFYTSRYYY